MAENLPVCTTIDEVREALGVERFQEVVEECAQAVSWYRDDTTGMYVVDVADQAEIRYGDEQGVLAAMNKVIDDNNERSFTGTYAYEQYFKTHSADEFYQEVAAAFWEANELDPLSVEAEHHLFEEFADEFAGRTRDEIVLDDIEPVEWSEIVLSKVYIDYQIDEIMEQTKFQVDLCVFDPARDADFDYGVDELIGVHNYGIETCDVGLVEHSSLNVLCSQQGVTLEDALLASDYGRKGDFASLMGSSIAELLANENGTCAQVTLLASMSFKDYCAVAAHEAGSIEFSEAVVCLYDCTVGAGEVFSTNNLAEPIALPTANLEYVLPESVLNLNDTFQMEEAAWDNEYRISEACPDAIEVNPIDAERLEGVVEHAIAVAMGDKEPISRGNSLSDRKANCVSASEHASEMKAHEPRARSDIER